MEKLFAFGAIGSVSSALIYLSSGGGDATVRYGLISSLQYLMEIGASALQSLPV